MFILSISIKVFSMVDQPIRIDDATNQHKRRVLISGAGFGGLAAAWWMNRLGYAVTVVEIATELRKGGTPVDIKGGVVDIMRRMGLEQIISHRLPPKSSQFLDANGAVIAPLPRSADDEMSVVDTANAEAGYEIERDVLLDLLFREVKDDTEFLFGDSISSLEELEREVAVSFRSHNQRSFDLVLGCDGTHSAVRKMCFGEEYAFNLFLQNYFSLTIVSKLLIEENTHLMYNVPGKAVMVSAYNGKTDIALCFFSEQEISYDRRDQDSQKRMVRQHLGNEGWRVPEFLEEMERGNDFYFDKLCQIRMPSWTKGRVALVGDAGYCPSPAAGMGGSMAILGAAALADALGKYPDDLNRAFQEYEESFRPVVKEVQTQAVEIGMEMFMPRSLEALQRRNWLLKAR